MSPGSGQIVSESKSILSEKVKVIESVFVLDLFDVT